MDCTANKLFSFGDRLGSGSFGTVFRGEHTQTHEPVAIKREDLGTGKSPQLVYETQVLKSLNGALGFPKPLGFWKGNGYQALAMTLLGMNLEDIFHRCSRSFTVKTVLMLADQMISRVQFLHEKNVIHRDIKPENFAVGLGKETGVIYLLDFGLSKAYRDPITHVHIPPRDRRPLVGTVRYASLNNHCGMELSRRDDLESLAYIFIYFLRGNLPWQGVRSGTKDAKMRKILDRKERTPLEELCEGLPNEFAVFLARVRKLGFDERPHYEEYREMFRKAITRLGFVYDCKWCWDEPGAVKEEQEKPETSRETVELGVADRITVLRRSKNVIVMPDVLVHDSSRQKKRLRSQRSKPMWMRPFAWL